MKKSYIYKLSAAINEFNEQYLESSGYGYYVTAEAPNTYKKLKQYKGQNVIPVYSGGSDKAIYEHAYMNYNFRAVHDFHHIKFDAPFTLKGECKAIKEHFKSLETWINWEYTGTLAKVDILKLFLIDTFTQVEYYYENNDFVQNQLYYAIGKMCEETLKELEIRLNRGME